MQLVEFLDITLVSAVLFLCLSWLRRSLPRDVIRRNLAIVPVAGALYLASLTVGLSLFEWLLETLAIVVLVATVVVYQADVRRMLDGAFAGRAETRPSAHWVTVLDEVVPQFATANVGALIAVRGREAWSSHISGGVPLGGKISVPLLQSLFDHRTAGHDGAVLLEGDTVTHFAAHLPLASPLPEVSRFGGTRHAAALGLARECDALVIVVSEERGTISIAEEGALTALTDADGLVQHLRAFQRRLGRRPSTTAPPLWRHARMQTGALSVGLAMVLWFALVYSPDTILRTFTVPVVIRNLPAEWAVSGPLPTAAQIDVAGPESRLAELEPEALGLTIDLAVPTGGPHEVMLSEEHLSLPPGTELRRIEPASVLLDLRRTRVVNVPVVVPAIGIPPPGAESIIFQPDPTEVSLVVPESEEPPIRLVTQPVDLGQVTDGMEIESQLILPAGTRLTDAKHRDVTVVVEFGGSEAQ